MTQPVYDLLALEAKIRKLQRKAEKKRNSLDAEGKLAYSIHNAVPVDTGAVKASILGVKQ